MKDLGDLQYILGICVTCDNHSLYLNQQAHVEQILNKFGIKNCNPVSTPSTNDVRLVKVDGSRPVNSTEIQSLMGSLLYLAVATRPDMAIQWKHFQNSIVVQQKHILQLQNMCLGISKAQVSLG